jgi:hypothetical protein
MANSTAGASGGVSSGDAASGLSLASMGFQAMGTIDQAEGTKAADDYKSEQLQQAATYGELKATQTNAQLTQNLSMTLGNIDAVRAAGHTDPSSPTGAAVRNTVENIADTKKNIQVDSISAQAQEDEANAAYLRSAGSEALLSGEIGAGAGILSSVAKSLPMAMGA